MAKKRRKKTRGPRKNPKRVAAGKKAAAKRFAKKTRKSSKRISVSSLEKTIDRIMARKYAITVDGNVHRVAFRAPKVSKVKRKRRVSAETLAHLARGRAVRKANLSLSKGEQYGPVYNPTEQKKGMIYAKRLANLVKARAARAAKKEPATLRPPPFMGGWI